VEGAALEEEAFVERRLEGGLKSKLVYEFCEEAGVVKVACLC
jgi:hypothetical protein